MTADPFNYFAVLGLNQGVNASNYPRHKPETELQRLQRKAREAREMIVYYTSEAERFDKAAEDEKFRVENQKKFDAMLTAEYGPSLQPP